MEKSNFGHFFVIGLGPMSVCVLKARSQASARGVIFLPGRRGSGKHKAVWWRSATAQQHIDNR